MILTEKGSTRGTVSLLFLSALIILGARFAVTAIEESMQRQVVSQIQWKPVNDIMKESDDDAFDVIVPEKEAKKPEQQQTVAATASDAEKKPTTDKKSPRKRFAVERAFPDNVDQRPLFIFFADDGSVISRKMENTSLTVPAVRQKIEKDFYPVKIAFDKRLSKTEFKLYRNYGAAAAPLISIRAATGEPLAYATGYLSATKLMIVLKNAQRNKKRQEDGLEIEK